MIVGRRNKETADIIRHTIDFTDWLDAGETIDTVIGNDISVGTTGWSNSPFPQPAPYDPSPMAIRSTTVVGSSKEVQVFLTSGTPGNVYTMTLKVLGTSGREKVVELEIQVTGIPPQQPVVAQPGVNITALSITGGTMQGPLYVVEDPLTDMEVSTKRYTDNLFLTAERDLATEAAARIAEDTVLQGEITAEITRAEAAESTLTTNLAAEVTARAAADTTLQTNITNEATTRAAADTTLTTNLAAEVTRAEAAEASLTTSISSNSGAITTEAAARAAADTTLQNNINAEAVARNNADTSLSNAILAETTRAEAAEAAITASLTSSYNLQHGSDAVGSGDAGHHRVTFPVAYGAAPTVVVTVQGAGANIICTNIVPDAAGFDIWASTISFGGPAAAVCGFYWIAVGT